MWLTVYEIIDGAEKVEDISTHREVSIAVYN